MRWSLVILLFFASNALAQIEFNVSVDRTNVRVGDRIKLVLEIRGAASGVRTPVMPSLAGLEVVGGPSRSSELQIINGRMTGTTVYTYTLRTTTPGIGKIGPSTLTHRGKQYATKPITIKISDAGKVTAEGDTKRQTEDVFVRIHADKKKAFKSEKIVLTYTVYFRSSITSPEIVRLPQTAGFWVEEFPLPRDLPIRTEVVNGMQYRTAVFKKIALFPTRTGKLTVEPLLLRTKVEAKTRRRDRFNLFDDPFFRRGRTETREVRSPSVAIEVKPLPNEGKPADFSGAVGDFKIEATLDKTAVPAHEAVTLTFKISGEGNIKTLPEPMITFSPDIEHYDPKISENIRRSNGRIRGLKKFEYLLIPRAAGLQRISPITYSYFNPKTKDYVTLSTPEISLEVTRGTRSGDSGFGIPVATKRGVEQIGQDIAYIKVESDVFQRRGTTPYEEVTFWLVLAAPWAAVAVVYVEKRRRRKLGAVPLRERNLRAPKRARKGFAQAKRSLQQDNEEAFYGHIAHTLRAYLAARLNQPGDDFAITELEELWNDKAWPPDTLDEIRRILSECDFTRFASGSLPTDKRGELLQEARAVVEKVEQLIAGKGGKG